MGTPEHFPASPNLPRSGRPVGRVIVAPDVDPSGPALFEWELRAEEWSDLHPHDEFVYVIDGELVVESGGTAITAGAGSVVKVPGGARGTYRAPLFARVLSVYGPRPVEVHDAQGRLRRLDEGCASCGSPSAPWVDSPEGRIRMCPSCAVLHGLGCP